MSQIRILKDDDCHTYFVPVGSEKAFYDYVESEGELGIPDGVVAASSHLSQYVFETPVLEKDHA